jgi:Glu-tRNA(Gln) amidotransferase subunit E-like FAD-binding protein
MYPETDIPLTLIQHDLIEKVRSNLPESAENKIQRLMKQYELNEKLAKQIADSEYSILFEKIAGESEVSATTIAAFLSETLKSLRREDVEVEKVTDGQLREIFKRVGLGELAKESISDVCRWLSKNEDETVSAAVENLGLKMLSEKEIEELVQDSIEKNKPIIDKIGKNAFSRLMGIIMKQARGKANAELVSKILKEKLNHFTANR